MTSADAERLRFDITVHEGEAKKIRTEIDRLALELALIEAANDGVKVGDQYLTSASGVLMEIVAIAPYPNRDTAYMVKVAKVRKDGQPANMAPSTEYRRTVVNLLKEYNSRPG